MDLVIARSTESDMASLKPKHKAKPAAKSTSGNTTSPKLNGELEHISQILHSFGAAKPVGSDSAIAAEVALNRHFAAILNALVEFFESSDTSHSLCR